MRRGLVYSQLVTLQNAKGGLRWVPTAFIYHNRGPHRAGVQHPVDSFVNCPHVKIKLFCDGGGWYPRILVENIEDLIIDTVKVKICIAY